MRIIGTDIPAVRRVIAMRHGDDRGWFCETYRADLFAEHDITNTFVQDNQSFSGPVGTIRGLHFQTPPHAQTKLVRVLAGAIFDVAVDLRKASPTFGRHVGVHLDARNGEQLLVPAGFAHGFCTLEPNTMVAYKVDAYYSPEHDRNLAWDDPDIGIRWPMAASEAILSDRDRAAPRLADLELVF